MEGDIVQMQEIFKYVRTGTAADGTVEGHFQATGVRPRFLAELVARGIKIPGELLRSRSTAAMTMLVRPRPASMCSIGFAALSAGLFVGRRRIFCFFGSRSYRKPHQSPSERDGRASRIARRAGAAPPRARPDQRRRLSPAVDVARTGWSCNPASRIGVGKLDHLISASSRSIAFGAS